MVGTERGKKRLLDYRFSLLVRLTKIKLYLIDVEVHQQKRCTRNQAVFFLKDDIGVWQKNLTQNTLKVKALMQISVQQLT